MSKLELIQEIENKSNIGHVHSDLNEQIETLSNTRGYLSTRQIEDNTDFNDIPKLNGIYMISTRTNAPMILEYNHWYFVKVTVHNDLYLTQEAWTFVGEKSQRWVRVLDNNVWRPWVQMADTEQINVLSIDRGYKDSSVHGSGDMNTFTNNGKYYGKNLTNMPTGSWSVFDVTNNGGDWDVAQIVHATDQGISHIRYKNGISWKVKQIATTDKTDILVTPRPNRTIIYNNSYKDSMGFVVDVRVKNTDDSDIPVGYDAWFDGLPYIGDVYKPISAICLNASGAYVGECVGYRWGSGVYLYPSVVCKSIAVYDYVGGDK